MRSYCVIMNIDGTLTNSEHRLHLPPKRVTQMWRDNGVRCLHVCEGDY